MKQPIGQRLKELVGEVQFDDITNHMMIDILEQRLKKLEEEVRSANARTASAYEKLDSIHQHNRMVGRYLNYAEECYFIDDNKNKFKVLLRFVKGRAAIDLMKVLETKKEGTIDYVCQPIIP